MTISLYTILICNNNINNKNNSYHKKIIYKFSKSPYFIALNAEFFLIVTALFLLLTLLLL